MDSAECKSCNDMAHICSYLAQRAACLPDKILTVCLEHANSTQVVSLEVAALSKALREAHGIRLGDRIGLIAKGTDAFFKASFLTTMRALSVGYVALSIWRSSDTSQDAPCISDARSRVLLCSRRPSWQSQRVAQ